MIIKLLNKVRLTYFFFALAIIFFFVLYNLPRLTLSGGQLGLFGVTGFLFGYYFAPIYNGQKARVATMADAVRQEALSIYDILTQTHLLDDRDRLAVKAHVKAYLESIVDNQQVQAENKQYDDMLKFLTGKENSDNSVMQDIYQKKVSSLQQHRDTLHTLYSDRVNTNEWITALVLFMINVFFVVQINYGHSLLFNAMAAALCASLSMLLFTLIKYSTLTHKDARQIWAPIRTVLKNNFEDVAEESVLVQKA